MFKDFTIFFSMTQEDYECDLVLVLMIDLICSPTPQKHAHQID